MKFMILDDVQDSTPSIVMPLQRVGIKGLNYPLHFMGLSLMGSFDLATDLRSDVRGTHMSRFVDFLQSAYEQDGLDISFQRLPLLLNRMLKRFEGAEKGFIEIAFRYYRSKKAPVSLKESFLDYPLKLMIEGNHEQYELMLEIVIPVTTLCPCSKKISKYGAHNQRSLLTIKMKLGDLESFDLDNFLTLCEEKGSCEIYGLVKRPDEKYMTERAYERPKFVEDVMRELIVDLRSMPMLKLQQIECENIESIHHHSAYALHRE